MRSERLALVALLSACGGRDVNLGDGPLDAGPGPITDAASPRDAGEPGDAGADGGATYSISLLPLTGGDGKDDDPALSADLGLLLFNSTRAGGSGKEDVWFAERADGSGEFGAPAPASELNTEDRETGIALAPDGLTVWFSSDRPGGAGGLDVYVAKRAARDAAWSSPTQVKDLASAGDELVSAVDATGTRLFLSKREAGGVYDLYVATRANRDAPFAAPEPLSTLNTASEESDACPFAGGSRIVFTREGELIEAALVAGVFQELGPLGALNSDGDDRDAWLSDDGDLVVFSSDRSGAYLLYQATR